MTYCIWALIKTLLLLEREVAVAQYATGILGRLKLDGAAKLSNKKNPIRGFFNKLSLQQGKLLRKEKRAGFPQNANGVRFVG